MEFIKKHIMYIIIGFVIIISIIFSSFKPGTEAIYNEEIIPTFEEIEYIYVDLKGEVLNPGVYKITSSTRLYQLIEKAGGLTSIADPLKINLSILLKDQDVIYVPSIFDEDIVIIEDDDTDLIDINQANKALLTTLPGIGEVTAEAIIDYRNEYGYFDQIEDIMNVPGIGESTYENIKDLITT